jgi:hypothetical protein
MSRALTTAAANATAAAVVRPVLLIELEFSDGTVRYTTADRDVTYDSNNYDAAGHFASISQVMEGTELEANRIIVGINGVPSANISLAIGQTYQNRPATVYLGFLDANYALVADPFIAFKGRMDSMDIELGKTASIQVGIESRLVDWDKARIRRYTNEDQQNYFAGDKGLEFMNEMVDKQLVWGRT